jgi:1,2-diacylglycerol 3-alpha-glucosyltransferase
VTGAGLDDRIHRPGFVQYGALPAYYASAGACVLPSLSDQWGLAINEAMASGLPVIVSRACGCARDLVVEGANGHTFDPLDREELTRILHRVASSPRATLDAMASASRERISGYSPVRFARALAAAAGYGLERRRAPKLGTRILLKASAMGGV